jgi:Sulfotransferase family
MNVQERRWPNLFIVGAGKAGTSSLADYLGQHPDIFMAPVKEPHFFSDADPRLTPPIKDEEAYLRLFAGASTEKLRGEASVSYLWDTASPRAIKRASPDARILVLLRDPVDRAYSHYWHAFKNGVETRSFQQAVEDELAGVRPPGLEPYLERSRYAEALARYLDVFGASVYVLFFEDLVRDAAGELRKVFAFLDVEPAFAQRLDTGIRNAFALPRNRLAGTMLRSPRVRKAARAVVPSRSRRGLERLLLEPAAKPPMPREACALLEGAYDTDRMRLERLLNRRVPW